MAEYRAVRFAELALHPLAMHAVRLGEIERDDAVSVPRHDWAPRFPACQNERETHLRISVAPDDWKREIEQLIEQAPLCALRQSKRAKLGLFARRLTLRQSAGRTRAVNFGLRDEPVASCAFAASATSKARAVRFADDAPGQPVRVPRDGAELEPIRNERE
jgi:hypothetical protein